MPIILNKRLSLSQPFYIKLIKTAGFGVLTACQIVTDAVGSTKEINENFPAFRFVNYLMPAGVFAEATVYQQNIEGGADHIRLSLGPRYYLSNHFGEALDFHLANDPYAGEWTSENLIPQSSEAEQTSLASSTVKKDLESESQTVGQDPDLIVGSKTQEKQDAILGPELKRLEKEKKLLIFSDYERFLLDRYYRLNQYILNFPELVLTLEGELEQKRKRLNRVQGEKTQQSSVQQDETTRENLSRQDKTIRALESEIQKLEAQKLKKDKLDGEITHLQEKINKLVVLESFANEEIQKLEAQKLKTEMLNDEIADLQKQIRSSDQKSLEYSKSFAEKKRYNLEKQKSELENSKQKLEREALGKERRMAEQRLILLEEYLEEKYFERIAQAKEQPMEGDHLTNEQLPLFTTLVKEGQSKAFYLRLALAASILLAVTGSVAVYYVSLSVFSTLAFLGPLIPLLPYLMIVLACLTAIGTAYLVYNTLADIIIRDKWLTLDAIRDWFSRGENESRVKHVFRIIAAIVGIIISFAAIAATGYTIYAQLLPILGPIASIFAMLSCVLTEFIFTMKNSVESIGMLKGECDVGNELKTFFLNLKTQIASENPLQWALHLIRLPLQFVLLIFKLAVFMLHVGVTAVSSDRLPSVPPFIVMIISGLSELLTDFSQLFSNKDDEAEHGHDHGGGPLGLLRNLFFITPALVLGCLNYLFSQLNRLNPNPKKEYLSFKEAINQELIAFDIKHSHEEEEAEEIRYVKKRLEDMRLSMPEPVNSSTPVTPLMEARPIANGESNPIPNQRVAFFPLQVVSQPLKKEIKRLESKKSECAKEKVNFLRAKLSLIEDKTINDSDKVKAMRDSGSCLEKHRLFFHLPYKETTSAKKWREIQELCEESCYDPSSFRCSMSSM